MPGEIEKRNESAQTDTTQPDFWNIIIEPENSERLPLYEALNPKQKKWLRRVEQKIDERLLALEDGHPIKKETEVKYKFKTKLLDENGYPVRHSDYDFEMDDYHFGETLIRTEQSRYGGVNVIEHDQYMAAVLVERYRALQFHVLVTGISLNDPSSVSMREQHDKTMGQFYEIDICNDYLPTPAPNPFSDVETISFGK